MSEKIWVQSACAGRILNDLNRDGIAVQCVQKEGRVVCFCVPTTHKSRTADYLRKRGLAFRTAPRGIAACRLYFRSHILLWIALAVVAAAIGVVSGVVWRVQIQCSPELLDEVQAVVARADPTLHFANRVDYAGIKEEVLAISGVALASVYRKGIYLMVEVKEELPAPTIQEESYAPIVAACDCIVERVVVERGRAMVQAGQSVRKGDVLIAPEYLLDKTQQITTPTQAIGHVYGKVFLVAETLYCERQWVWQDGQDSMSFATISVGGVTMGDIPSAPYAHYRTVQQTITLGQWLPVEVCRTTYIEQRQVEIYCPWEQAKEGIMADLEAQIVAQLKNNVTIARKWCIINNTGSTYSVRAYVEVEQEVGLVE